MSSAFVSKSRKVRFNLILRIIDLNNVPLVSGTSFIKWHLPSSTAAEHRGRTPQSAIKDHRVLYEYSKTLPVRLTVGKDGMLQECMVDLEVLQEYSAGGRPERISLGQIKLNLAEYVDARDVSQNPGLGTTNRDFDGEPGVVRRYLMQESKINSTLKLGISMRHVEGTKDYYAPPLKTAPVFGGIAGIISSSEPASTTHGVGSRGANDSTHNVNEAGVPSLSTTNREMGEMQDMYRRTLAAFWAAQPGELKADECIENIFDGGDGWGKHGRPQTGSHEGSGASTPNPEHSGGDGRPSDIGSIGRGTRGKFGKYNATVQLPRKGAMEIDEFDVREDLRSWRIGERAYS